MTRRRPAIGLLFLALLCVGCGDESELDPTDPKAVAEAFVRALGAPDFDGLVKLMTPECTELFKRDMLIFQGHLADAQSAEGGQVHRIGREKLGERWQAAVTRGRDGTWKDAWQLLLEIQAMPDAIELHGPKGYAENPDVLRVQYRRAAGVLKELRLERRHGHWAVAKAGL